MKYWLSTLHLCVYFLRSALSLSVEPTHLSVSLGAENVRQKDHTMKLPSTYPHPIDQGHIVIRQATLEDVPSIQKCNLATLPENYFPDFYTHLMRLWPDLAIVAEHVIPSPSVLKKNPFETFTPSLPRTEIIGYALAHVEIKAMPSKVSTGDENIVPVTRRTVHIGHIVSLAVLKEFRRKGIARIMMNEEHDRLRHQHSAALSDLHVRASNVAAQRLYAEQLGYQKSSIRTGYYKFHEDKEDGILMIKNLETLDARSNHDPLPIELSLP